MNSIAEHLDQVRDRLRTAERRFMRVPNSTALLAVSKTQSADAVRAAAEAGQHAFGENYLQDAEGKMAALRDLALEWHFIGPLQSNKTRRVAEGFDFVHTIDRLRIARRLSEQRPAHLPPLACCIQVNISAEPDKSGVAPEAAGELANAIARLPRLRLRGLMAIPAASDDFHAQREPHARLHQLFDQLNADGLRLDTLSMGMSDDLEAAVAEGATIVRVGTAIFGARHY